MTVGELMAPVPAALIFDLDGTLLDTEPLYTEAANAVLAPYGKAFDPELKRRTMGGDARRSAAIVIDTLTIPLSVDSYLEKRESYLRELFPKAPEIDGAGRFLAGMEARGLGLGLATSSVAELTRLKLSGRPWAGVFNAEICGDDPRLERAKPEPDIYLLCADDLGVEPRDCLVFEDSPNGIAGAKRAGMRVVAIESPHVKSEDLAEADLLVADFIDAGRRLAEWW